ncbi:transposase [Comamonas thiooxydans]|uniref:transposase n=1 Tax=Comamonas thiooxydans TaxID=363952 RepID=UPI003C7A772E
MHAQLDHMGERVNLKQVERLMRVMDLQSVSRPQGFVVNTERNPSARPALESLSPSETGWKRPFRP